ncbi:Serine/threonine-protein kinase 40 [Sarcoptes scabiei]|uniref:Serine/threonine-protein kinase 40 n=2 Tax=Sarcoptes scabiei TaxID=52283 RepID=A0A834R9Y5_SARSC|nr:Serine/threonine-protein kinase 40 [Sarcoptes scabiei]
MAKKFRPSLMVPQLNTDVYEDAACRTATILQELCDDHQETFEKTFSNNYEHNHQIRAGPFVLCTQLNEIGQFCGIDLYIGRKIADPNPNRYYYLKMATFPKNRKNETEIQHQAKFLLHNEYSILSLLRNEPGIVQVRGFYMDFFLNKSETTETLDSSSLKCSKCYEFIAKNISINLSKPFDDSLDHFIKCPCEFYRNFKIMRRLILAIDCHIPHLFCSTFTMFSNKHYRINSEYENLQEYIKRSKIIAERKALEIFAEIVEVISRIHGKNIAHRDLRLENIIYNHKNGKVIIINFGLSRYVINDTICINDHRGSSAYISPDVLKRKPYPPKASDCWALGIIFYSMLYGKFPFYADNFSDLFKKISSGSYRFNPDVLVSASSRNLLGALIQTNLNYRIKIDQLRKMVDSIIKTKMDELQCKEMSVLIKNKQCDSIELQTVPDIDLSNQKNKMFVKQNPQKLSNQEILTDQESDTEFDPYKAILDIISILGLNDLVESNFVQEYTTSNNLGNRCSRTNRDVISNNLDHLHDHDYLKINDPPSTRTIKRISKRTNSFNEYLLNSSNRKTPHNLPIPYLKLRNRFYNAFESNYLNGLGRSLLAKEILDSSRNSNDFDRMERLKSRNKFEVIRVDSDVRLLNEQEYKEMAEYLQHPLINPNNEMLN